MGYDKNVPKRIIAKCTDITMCNRFVEWEYSGCRIKLKIKLYRRHKIKSSSKAYLAVKHLKYSIHWLEDRRVFQVILGL